MLNAAHDSIKDQKVVITAAAGGIGAVMAQEFADAGSTVFICDINDDAVVQKTEEHPNIHGMAIDVSNADQVRRFIKRANDEMGTIDVLINNAGIGGGHAAIDAIDDETWMQTMAVNINGAFWCVREVTPIMRSKQSGCIINISTGSVRTGLPFRLPYVTSKAALAGFTKNIARELGPHNIRCNSILPGAIDNDRGRGLIQRLADQRGVSFEKAKEQELSYVSMRTTIDMTEIAAAAIFLASHAGRHISGQEIGVCGNIEWEQ